VIRSINPAGERILGATAAEVVGKSSFDWVWNSVHEDGSPFPVEEHPSTLSLRTGRSFSACIMGFLRDDHVTWISVNTRPLFMDNASLPHAVVISFSDITDRKNAEDALRQSEERYRTIFENAPLGLFRSTFDGRFLEVNPALAQMLGYESSEAVIKEIQDIGTQVYVRSEDRPRIVEQQVTARTVSHYINHYRRKDSSMFVANLYLTTVVDRHGDPLYLEGIVEDVTEQRRAQEALQSSEAQKQAILDGITSNLVFVSRQLEVLWANEAAASCVGLPAHDMKGRKCYEFFGTGDGTCTGCPGTVAFQTGRTERTDIVRRDGRVWGVGASPVFAEGGSVMGVVCIAKDITDERKARELMLQAEKHRAVADLSSGVAHNFNNLLQIVLGNTELALLDVHAGSFSDIAGKLDEIRETSRFGVETVRRLQQFVRNARLSDKRGIEPIDLSEVTRQAAIMNEPIWKTEPERRGVTISLECRLSPNCMVRGSRRELFDVVGQLISNAVQAMPAGGHITLETEQVGEHVVMRVRDTGTGIPAEDIHRVFTPFFTTSLDAGKGLGLAMCRTIVTSHEGHISVESLESEGATFTVVFPSSKEQTLDEGEE
jgi:PAS domain S-box-containing protein